MGRISAGFYVLVDPLPRLRLIIPGRSTMPAKMRSRVKVRYNSRNRSGIDGVRPPKRTPIPQISSQAAEVVSQSKGKKPSILSATR